MGGTLEKHLRNTREISEKQYRNIIEASQKKLQKKMFKKKTEKTF